MKKNVLPFLMSLHAGSDASPVLSESGMSDIIPPLRKGGFDSVSEELWVQPNPLAPSLLRGRVDTVEIRRSC